MPPGMASNSVLFVLLCIISVSYKEDCLGKFMFAAQMLLGQSGLGFNHLLLLISL